MSLFSEPIAVLTVSEMVGSDGRTLQHVESETEVLGAFRQRASIDSFNNGRIVTDEVVAYLPPDTVVDAGDRLRVRGEEYEVVSTAFPQVNFRTGAAHHVEVRVRRSER